jgi:Ca2+-binding EF-hand superfamily protein
MSKFLSIQRTNSSAQQGPTLRVTNEQALQMLRTKMSQRLSSQASGGELRRSFELLDRDKSGNVELAELEEVRSEKGYWIAVMTAAAVCLCNHFIY